jgi:hypothetical protein
VDWESVVGLASIVAGIGSMWSAWHRQGTMHGTNTISAASGRHRIGSMDWESVVSMASIGMVNSPHPIVPILAGIGSVAWIGSQWSAWHRQHVAGIASHPMAPIPYRYCAETSHAGDALLLLVITVHPMGPIPSTKSRLSNAADPLIVIIAIGQFYQVQKSSFVLFAR